jgi:hypothetical protein
MKTCSGNRGINPVVVNHGIRWRWLVNITSWPLYCRERTPVSIEENAKWALEPVWTIWKTEKSLNPVRTGIPDRPASRPQPSRYTDYDISAQMKPKSMQISIKEDTQSS